MARLAGHAGSSASAAEGCCLDGMPPVLELTHFPGACAVLVPCAGSVCRSGLCGPAAARSGGAVQSMLSAHQLQRQQQRKKMRDPWHVCIHPVLLIRAQPCLPSKCVCPPSPGVGAAHPALRPARAAQRRPHAVIVRAHLAADHTAHVCACASGARRCDAAVGALLHPPPRPVSWLQRFCLAQGAVNRRAVRRREGVNLVRDSC